MGFSHFHGSFSNPSPFKGEVSPAPRRVQDKALNLTWFRGGGWGIYVAVVLISEEDFSPRLPLPKS